MKTREVYAVKPADGVYVDGELVQPASLPPAPPKPEPETPDAVATEEQDDG